jgi:hypothetical protein
MFALEISASSESASASGAQASAGRRPTTKIRRSCLTGKGRKEAPIHTVGSSSWAHNTLERCARVTKSTTRETCTCVSCDENSINADEEHRIFILFLLLYSSMIAIDDPSGLTKVSLDRRTDRVEYVTYARVGTERSISCLTFSRPHATASSLTVT